MLHNTIKILLAVLLSVAILSGCYSDERQALASADLPLITDSSTVTFDLTQITTSEAEIAPEEIEKENNMKVIGYLTTWNYSCYETLDWSALTHINLAFINSDANGNFINPIGNDEKLKDIIDTAHKNGVKVLISLGGWGGSVNYPSLISTDEGIKSLNENLLDFVKEFGLDGIDIDIEGDVDKMMWTRYDAWIGALRSLCDENGLLLTTACAKWYADNISDYALSLFDFVNVMIYDDTTEDNHASMKQALTQLDYFESRGIEKKDLLVGVPFYGRAKDSSYMSYKDIISKDPSYFEKDQYDKFSYNGKNMMIKKCELSKAYGGIMIWELGEDAPAPYSLLDVIGDCLF